MTDPAKRAEILRDIPAAQRESILARWSPAERAAVLEAFEHLEKAHDASVSAKVVPIGRGRRKPEPTTSEMSEIDVAELVIVRHGADLRFCADLGGWHAWTGTHWQLDKLERAREAVKDVARGLASTLDEETMRTAMRIASASGTSSILNVMRSDPRIVFAPDQANADPWLLSTETGTIDLRTGALRPHDPADLITRCAPVAFDPAAACPMFDAFLAEVQPDVEVRAYLARLFGYAACGVVHDHVLGVLWGPGANGKSVLADVLMHALGDYARPGPSSLIVQNGNHAPHPTDVASCVGSRLVVVHETSRGATFDASKVKLLTGGDRLTARHMREDFFDFRPSHTLVMLSNYRPEADATDAALWRRVQLVPFAVVVPEEKRDERLAEKIIAAELPGVLAWIVRGCLDWQARKLSPPASVRQQTEAYRASEDTIADFLADRCVVGPGMSAKAGQLYEAFKGFCSAAGVKPVRGNDFAAELTGRGFEKRRAAAGATYHGIGMRDDASPAQSDRSEW